MKPSMNWPFPRVEILFDDPITEKCARWCFAHFSPGAVDILRETIWIFYIKHDTWLNPNIARLFAYHIEPMNVRMHEAMEKGELDVNTGLNLKVHDHAAVIGAFICEMLDKRQISGVHLYKSLEIHQHARQVVP